MQPNILVIWGDDIGITNPNTLAKVVDLFA